MSLQTRVTNILTKPAGEWPVIAAESTEAAGLMRDYAAPLAAIPAVCRFIGMTVIGISVPLVGTIRTGMVRGAAGAIVSWVFALAGAWLAAMVIEKLAPTFQSRGSMVQALKLVVYSMTPVWVAGVLNLIPALAVLGIIAALYAIYLFYLGLPVMMGTPEDKVVPYMAVSALVIIVLSAVLGAFAAAVTGMSTYGAL
jgi:Yip1-like protein